MAKTEAGSVSKAPGNNELDSDTIRGTNKVVRVGDCVLMTHSDTGKLRCVAKIEGIEADGSNNVKVETKHRKR